MLVLAFLLITVIAVTGTCLAALLYVCVGSPRLRQAADDRLWFQERLVAVAPYVGGLALILLINKGLQDHIVEFSQQHGVDTTPLFYRIEGDFVYGLQGIFPDEAVFYFSPMYVFGYVVLLVFPLLGYLFADSLSHLRTLVTAYAINYGVGVVFYAWIVAYGPRNFEYYNPEASSVSEPMFDLFPEVTELTSQVNSATNVFPSLHTSLSVTVLLLALLTRDEFPRWTPVAIVLCTSIVVSTMYLGIHWFVDVLAGIALAVVSVVVATAFVERRSPVRAVSNRETQ